MAHRLLSAETKISTHNPHGASEFKLTGSQIHLADFAIVGKLNYRNDQEPNDGIVGGGAGCADSSVSRVWVEHTKVGIWIYNGTHLLIEGCRFREICSRTG